LTSCDGGQFFAGDELVSRFQFVADHHPTQKVPDLLNRDFTAATTNVKYVGDIIYLPPAIGGIDLRLIIDVPRCAARLTSVAFKWVRRSRGRGSGCEMVDARSATEHSPIAADRSALNSD
jgi:hypothetical protein